VGCQTISKENTTAKGSQHVGEKEKGEEGIEYE